jgi:hypothetical protein
LDAQVQVSQEIDSIAILIGQQTDLHVKVTLPKAKRVVFPSYKRSQYLIPGVEVLKMKDDTVEVDNQTMMVTRSYTLTSFDQHVYAIPALKVKVDGKVYQGNQLALKVQTIPVDTLHPNQFYPPKDVQDNPFQWKEWASLFWLSILMLLCCALVIYLRDRLLKNKPVIVRIRTVKRVPAHQQALNEIDEIKQQRIDNQESQKEYYTKLTDALREYIVKRFGFNAMEMTSFEIIDRLQHSGDSKMIAELREIFQTADLVKFAKYETLINENDMNLVNAVNFIDQTKTDEKIHEERIVPHLSDDDIKVKKNRKVIKTLIFIIIFVALFLLGYVIYNIFMLLY